MKKEIYNPKYWKQYRRKRKVEILIRYAGDPPKCSCCSESHIEFLVIDHIDGGGTQHRKDNKLTGGFHLYGWLKKNNYPKGFRVLCDNCNMSRGRYGYCPHEL